MNSSFNLNLKSHTLLKSLSFCSQFSAIMGGTSGILVPLTREYLLNDLVKGDKMIGFYLRLQHKSRFVTLSEKFRSRLIIIGGNYGSG